MKEEIFDSILFDDKKHHDFIQPEKRDRDKPQRKYDFKLLILEVYSKIPPTGITIKISYTTFENNSVNYFEISMIKHRRKFIYENEMYILYLEDINDTPEGMKPLNFDFIDKRDEKSKARLFYSIKFH